MYWNNDDKMPPGITVDSRGRIKPAAGMELQCTSCHGFFQVEEGMTLGEGLLCCPDCERNPPLVSIGTIYNLWDIFLKLIPDAEYLEIHNIKSDCMKAYAFCIQITVPAKQGNVIISLAASSDRHSTPNARPMSSKARSLKYADAECWLQPKDHPTNTSASWDEWSRLFKEHRYLSHDIASATLRIKNRPLSGRGLVDYYSLSAIESLFKAALKYVDTDIPE